MPVLSASYVLLSPFSDLFKDSDVFANREVLSPHYMPDNLPFRDKQIENIVKYMTPSLRGERGRNLFVYGKTGTGKTSCVKHVVDKIKDLPTKARVSYINCRIYNSRYRVLYKITSDYLPVYAKRGYGLVDIYERIIDLPPGTSDAPLSIIQLLSLDGFLEWLKTCLTVAEMGERRLLRSLAAIWSARLH